MTGIASGQQPDGVCGRVPQLKRVLSVQGIRKIGRRVEQSILIFVSLLALITVPQCVQAGNYVVAWGDNADGKTNVPAAATNVMAIAAGLNHSLALRSDGTVVGWGRAPASTVPLGLSNVVAIAAGSGQSLVLKTDGTLVAWGDATAGTTVVPPGVSNVVAIACGDYHNLVLKADGTLYAWGMNYSGQTNFPGNLSNIVAIAAGNSGNLAIRADGTAWGSGSFTNLLNGFSNLVAGALVANGNSQGAVVRGDGTAFAWGYPTYSGSTNIADIIAVSGRSPFNQAGSIWLLRRNGTLVGLGGYLGQTNVYLNLSKVLAVAFGYYHHLAIVGDGFPLPTGGSLLAPGLADGRFTLRYPTVRGRSYRLELADSLAEGEWQMLPPVPGDGTLRVFTDPNASSQQRFYRIWSGP